MDKGGDVLASLCNITIIISRIFPLYGMASYSGSCDCGSILVLGLMAWLFPAGGRFKLCCPFTDDFAAGNGTGKCTTPSKRLIIEAKAFQLYNK